MEIWKGIILGIVQGFTEFLPVSSSGHLIFFQKLLNVDLEAGDMFLGIMLHIGTLFALLIVFYKKIINLFKSPKMLFLLILASIPAALVGVLLGSEIDKLFYGGKYLSYGFLLTAALLYVTQVFSRKYSLTGEITPKSAAVMGLFQAVAVLPGISRSGSTIAGGTFMKVNRSDTADFSFLMSIPVIGGAAFFEILKQFKSGGANIQADMAAVAVGTLFATISGFFAIKIMLRVIKKADYKYFSIYLVIIGIVTFINEQVGFF